MPKTTVSIPLELTAEIRHTQLELAQGSLLVPASITRRLHSTNSDVVMLADALPSELVTYIRRMISELREPVNEVIGDHHHAEIFV